MPTIHSFVGRKYELGLLKNEQDKPLASLIVIYGRRRVGKTRLVTEFYGPELWKFDGIEGARKDIQIKNFLDRLSFYTSDDLYKSIQCTTWLDALKLLDKAVSQSKKGYNKAVLLDELQYMAVRHSELTAAIKWAWDNLWKDKPGMTLILCGSVASFMVQKVVRSSALYGRVTLEICLKPFSIIETKEFVGGKKSNREICDLFMFLGGIPEYLQQINPSDSIYQNIARLAFCKDGYFVGEFDRIFRDIFQEEKIYKKIILSLSKNKSLKMPELAEEPKMSGGGGLAEQLNNLELAGFIKSFSPLNKKSDSKLKRYCLDDEYLFFYFKFIEPNLARIRDNTDVNYGISVLRGNSYKSWAGLAFERLCLKHANQIMKYLKIDQLAKNYGAYFNRASNSKKGVQIDLMFDRYDNVMTICELKYNDGLIGKEIINEVEEKIATLSEKKKTIEKVLITTNGMTKDLADSGYFSKVILMEDLFVED